MTDFHPDTPEQADIRSAFRTGTHLTIEAFAGTGKTNTLKRLVCDPINTNRSVCILAFNTKPARELKADLLGVDEKNVPIPGATPPLLPPGLRLSIRTYNSMGLGAIPGRARTDGRKMHKLMDEWLPTQQGLSVSYREKQQLSRLLDAARLLGLGPHAHLQRTGPIIKEGADLSGWDQIWDWLEEKPDPDTTRIASMLLLECNTASARGWVDFTDQVYYPVIYPGNWPSFDVLMVDEVQDASLLNHKMFRLIPAKQKVFVGDSNQSIYGFRGAATDSMSLLPRAVRNEPMATLPLTMTFRCGHAIVERAQAFVPDYKAAPSNPPGEVIHWDEEWHLGSIPPKGTVLCRNNAPLVKLALKLLAQRIPCTILGREFVQALIRDLKRAAKDNDSASASAVVDAFKAIQSSRVKANSSPSVLESANDKVECIEALASTCRTAGEILALLDRLFPGKSEKDEDSIVAASTGILLSTGHKAKGLEWDWVLHLSPSLIPSKYATKSGDPEALRQEENLRYVIETRPRKTLILAELDALATEANA